MHAISALEHTRSIQKIKNLSQSLECAGLSSEELIQKGNDLQKLYEAHHELIAELNNNAEDYNRQFRLVRQNYQLHKKKLK